MTIDDLASEQEEFARNQSLQIRKAELPKLGFCHNCGESVKSNYSFCDGFCRTDFERRESQKRGKV